MNLATIAREFREIPLGLIDAPALPARAQMDEQKLDELVLSIRTVGLIQPLVLARTGAHYEVIAGHRRVLACQRLGLVTAPSIIYPSKDAALEAIKYAENRHREDLNPADEAIWFEELLERDAGGDTDALAHLLGETRSYIEGRLLLFRGDVKVFEQLQAGEITIGVAQQLNRCADERMRRYFLHQAILGGATVAVVSGWIQQWKQDQVYPSGAPAPAAPAAAPYVAPETNYFTCVCCGGTENVHQMQPMQVHTYCKLAVLDKLLDAWHRGGRA